MPESKNYYYDEKNNEFQPPYQKRFTVLVGTDTPVVIDKLFGPTIFCDVRVTALFRKEDQEPVWRIEREVLGHDEEGNGTQSWEIMLEIPCQESIEFRDEWEEKQATNSTS